jgi:RNA polymerase sigma-70 factor (ECF subfamily)
MCKKWTRPRVEARKVLRWKQRLQVGSKVAADLAAGEWAVAHMAPSGDGELVEGALRDARAYALLVGRYEAALRRYVRRLMGGNEAHVEDILQEAFIKAYVSLNDFDQSKAWGPWIYRIAHNEAISFIRKQRAAPPLIDGEDGLLLMARIADVSGPQEAWAERAQSKELHACLDRLGPRYRDVLVLRYLEDKSYRDIGDILRLPPGTVATLIKRGLARLRSAMEQLNAGIGTDEE